MNTEANRTSKFLEAIEKYAKAQRDKMNMENRRIKEQEKIRIENEILLDAYNLIQKEMAQMRIDVLSECSKKESQGRVELFNKRKKITDEVFNTVTEKLTSLTKQKKYEDILKKHVKSIAEVLGEPGTVLYLSVNDEKHLLLIKKAFPIECEVIFTQDIKVGGVRGFNKNKGIIVDETFDRKLKDQIDWFVEKSGLVID